jgi:hypothetical protein
MEINLINNKHKVLNSNSTNLKNSFSVQKGKHFHKLKNKFSNNFDSDNETKLALGLLNVSNL